MAVNSPKKFHIRDSLIPVALVQITDAHIFQSFPEYLTYCRTSVCIKDIINYKLVLYNLVKRETHLPFLTFSPLVVAVVIKYDSTDAYENIYIF